MGKIERLELASDSIYGSKKRKYYFAGGIVTAKNANNALKQMRKYINSRR